MLTFVVILAVLAIAIALVLVYAATRPDAFVVRRETIVQAPGTGSSPSSTTIIAGAPGRPTRKWTRR